MMSISRILLFTLSLFTPAIVSAQYVALQPSTNQIINQPNTTTLSVSSINNVINPTLYPGADIGAQIDYVVNNLLVAPHQCATISIPAGSYSFSTTIVKPQCVFIEGNSAFLNYTGSGIAIAVSSPYSAQDPYSLGGIAHLTLSGPGGTSQSLIGIYVGGGSGAQYTNSTDSAVDQAFVDDQIINFGVGVKIGNNSSLDTWRGGAISSDNIGVWYPCNLTNSGESYGFYGVIVNNGGVGFQQDCYSEFKLYGGGVDYNRTALTGAGLYVTAYGTHFEQATGPLIVGQASAMNGQQLNLFGGALYVSNTGGNDPSFISIGGTSSNVNLNGVSLAAAPGHSVAAVVDWESTGQGQLFAAGLTGATSPTLITGLTSNVTVSAASLNTASLPNYSGSFIPSGIVEGKTFVGSAANSNGVTPGAGSFPYNGTFLGWNADDLGGSDFYNAFNAPASSNAGFNWWSNNNGAWVKVASLNRQGGLTLQGAVSATQVVLPGANWRSAPVAPSGSCSNGSLYSNTSGGTGSTFYVCVNGNWVNDK